MQKHIWPAPEPGQDPYQVQCLVCRQPRLRAPFACPVTGGWDVAASSPRSIRANIERCATCGFRASDDSASGALHGRCAHPARTLPRLISRDDLTAPHAPADCPGRGVVVMIGGPPPLPENERLKA